MIEGEWSDRWQAHHEKTMSESAENFDKSQTVEEREIEYEKQNCLRNGTFKCKYGEWLESAETSMIGEPYYEPRRYWVPKKTEVDNDLDLTKTIFKLQRRVDKLEAEKQLLIKEIDRLNKECIFYSRLCSHISPIVIL